MCYPFRANAIAAIAGEFLVAVAAMWKSLKKSLLSAQKALHVIPEPEEDSPAPSPDEPDHEARVGAPQLQYVWVAVCEIVCHRTTYSG
jgi:hypothetical protein